MNSGENTYWYSKKKKLCENIQYSSNYNDNFGLIEF